VGKLPRLRLGTADRVSGKSSLARYRARSRFRILTPSRYCDLEGRFREIAMGPRMAGDNARCTKPLARQGDLRSINHFAHAGRCLPEGGDLTGLRGWK
jgi:hypothetical protein